METQPHSKWGEAKASPGSTPGLSAKWRRRRLINFGERSRADRPGHFTPDHRLKVSTLESIAGGVLTGLENRGPKGHVGFDSHTLRQIR